ncbi:hypothetical protein ACVMIH_007084 [Bradyrhizobium sp. USDA 4503]
MAAVEDIDRRTQAVPLLVEQHIEKRLAPIGRRDRRQSLARPELLGGRDKLLDLGRERLPEWPAQRDGRIELDRPHRHAAKRRGAMLDQLAVEQQDQLSAVAAPGHLGRNGRRQQRGRVPWSGGELARGGPHRGRAGQRHLQQEEAVEAAGIDRDRSAIGDIVDGEAVEVGAIVMRGEIARGMIDRRQIVRTEDAADRFRRVVDARRRDACEILEPCACRICACRNLVANSSHAGRPELFEV